SQTAPSSLDAALSAFGLSRGTALGGGWHLILWSAARPVSQALAQLQVLPGIVETQPSHVYNVKRVPSDPLLGNQWALPAVSALNAWDLETGFSSRVTIAVVDTGVDSTHPDLTAKFSNTFSAAFDPNNGAYSPNNPSTPACNHATRVAGVAGAYANNHFEVAGMSWGAQLVSLKVFADADCSIDCGDKGAGQCLTNDPAIIAAINYSTGVVNTAAYGRIVVNMSLGGVEACGPALKAAITNAVAVGVVLVTAAGNDGGAVNTPGNCSGVIPVGATDSSGQIAAFSSRGAELANNGLVAPGVSVLTTDLSGKTATATGTSFASPMVAGAAALLLSAKPTLTPTQVKTDLRAGAEPLGGPLNNQGAGLLNAYRSLYLAINGSLPASTPASPSLSADLPQTYAFPNPFRLSESSRALFFVPPAIQTTAMLIRVYTLDGRLVRELGAPVWDGKNNDGNRVASGTYVFHVSNGSQSSRGRVSVLR
ncbi:MAG: S8 family serine peptidase, partial [Elusimicrobiota bacterium]